jgi:outer membrane protein assembly factor BamE (lipoprotein component of BamABCDE complex)
MLPRGIASTATSKRWAGLTCLLAVLTILGGCGYGSLPPRVVEGRRFPVRSAASVHQGMTAAEVREILGEPLEIQAIGGDERWHYFAREAKEEMVYILGFIPKRNVHSVLDYDLVLKLNDQIVKEAKYRETKVR